MNLGTQQGSSQNLKLRKDWLIMFDKQADTVFSVVSELGDVEDLEKSIESTNQYIQSQKTYFLMMTSATGVFLVVRIISFLY